MKRVLHPHLRTNSNAAELNCPPFLAERGLHPQ
ncbi:hypothetical protein J802_4467, partial [Acinetobacter baumannii 45002_9]